MRRAAPLFFVLLLLAACATAPSRARPEPDIACRVELVRGPEPSIAFTTDVRGDDDGETTFTIDDSWGGTQHAAECLSDVRIEERAGAELAIEHAQPARWTVRHAPGAPLRVRYVIRSNAFQADSNPSIHYKPIVNAQLVHWIGTLAFLLPDHGEPGNGDDEPAQRFRFDWIGFEDAGWKIATSFSTDASFDAALEPANFRQAVFLAAPDLTVHRRNIRGRKLVVAIAGAWDLPEGAFVDAAARVVDVERAFFDDDAYPYYLITCIPVGRKSEHGNSLGGTGLTDSFALFLQAGTDLDPASDMGSRLLHLLAHEMFHNWNGRIIGRANPEELVYWFSEGFTDFYARRLLYRAALMDTAEYVRDVNAKLAEYWTNSARSASAGTIREQFWKVDAVQKLPYQRGDVLALLIDHDLRTRGGALGLDDLMRELVERGRKGERISNDSLIETIRGYSSLEFAERVRRIAVDGEMPELPRDLLEPALTLSIEPVPTWDPGFDLDALRKEPIVRGVREGSNAWQAGLRDGQKLSGWSVNSGDTKHPIEVEVQDEHGARKISWMPLGPPIPTPQLHMNATTPAHGAVPL